MSSFADLDQRTPRVVSEAEQAIVDECMREFGQLQMWRNTTAAQWEEIAELIDPPSRNTFMVGNFNWPGQKKTDRQVDATGMMALERFAAILDSLLTPRNMFWHGLRASNSYLMKQRGVRLYYEQLTHILFKHRYKPASNFGANNQNVWKSLGAYGTAGMFIDALDISVYGTPGLRYKNVPIGELFLRENHQGVVDGFCRWFKLNAEQAWQKWGHLGTFPEVLIPPLKANSPTLFDFLHRVTPRQNRDMERLDHKGMPYASYYVSLTGRTLLSEGGYRSLPIAASRYTQTPWEINGRGPASYVLPALKTLNAMKTTMLKVGHQTADPVKFTADDGVVDANFRPGALNKGGVNSDGKLLIQPFPVGNIQITKEMMAEETGLINDAFLVSLFQLALDTASMPQMTATQVIERTNEKGILLAPNVGRQDSEYLGVAIPRELDVLAQQGLLPPMPPVLREAKGEYEVVFTSPLARAMRAQEAAGFMRTLEGVKELVSITQDMSLLDPFDFDKAIPAIADIQSVPESWMASPQAIQQKRQARAQQQQRQEAIQAAPAQAAIMKAQAVQAKNGMGQQQAQQPVQGAQGPAAGGPPLAQQLGQ